MKAQEKDFKIMWKAYCKRTKINKSTEMYKVLKAIARTFWNSSYINQIGEDYLEGVEVTSDEIY